MDNIAAESETTMINSLNFGLPETAQYITDRRHVNYFPSGKLDFIYQVKTTHILLYLLFVYFTPVR